MDITLTPMVAQSSEDASLIIIATFPVCAAGVAEGAELAAPPPEPPPQAVINAAIAPIDSSRAVVVTMFVS
jgi:hypothetical protein